MDKKQIEAYVQQIREALTEEAVDYIGCTGNESLLSDKELGKLFSKKFITFEDYLQGDFGMSLEYDDVSSEMRLFSDMGQCIWRVKCNVKDPKSIVDCAIECLNKSEKEDDMDVLNEDGSIMYKDTDENRCQKIYDRLILALDKEYQRFLKRKAKEDEEIEDPEDDPGWVHFYEKAEEMGQDALIEMGVEEENAERMYEEFWDDADIAEDDAEIDKNYQKLVEKFTKHFNKVIAEVCNVTCRIRLQMSDKYVY